MVHVCYALYDAKGTYAKFVGASLRSVLVNTREKVTAHILHDKTLGEENKRRLTEIADKNGGRIRFYDVALPADLFDELKAAAVSPAAVYRLRLAEIIDKGVKRVVYLDADTIVNLDIKEIARFDMNGKSIAAVSDEEVANNSWPTVPLVVKGYVDRNKYFNSGVLVIDMERLRGRKDFFAECYGFWKNNRYFCRYLDQDILNFLFKDDRAELPPNFNEFVYTAERGALYGKAYRPLKSAVYHYAGGQLDFDGESPQSRLFFGHFAKTPFCDADFLMRALKMPQKLRDEQMERERRLRRLLGGVKKRLFWGEDKYEGAMREALPFAENDTWIKADALDANGAINIADLKAKVSECRKGESIVVIIFAYYDKLREHLANAGFVENEQFADGRILLTCGEGVKPWKDSELFGNL